MTNDATVLRLTLKEEAFCVAVFAGQNPSDAYRTAYKPQRAKSKTIHEMASRLMAKRKVHARLIELMQPVIQRAQLSRDQWLESLARICLADIRRMFDEHGNPLPVTKLGSAEAAAIAAFEVYSGGAAKNGVSEVGGRMLRVRKVDQLKALELYGKAMGYFSDRREMSGVAGTGPIITVEFVNPADQLHRVGKETPLSEKPGSLAACGGTALTY